MSKKIVNYLVVGVLTLGVFGIGITAYYQQVQADTIVPGYATAHLHFNVTVPVSQNIKIKATFTPQSGKNFYFKEREFEISNAGLNTIEWYIRKIPAGTYKLTVISPQGSFQSDVSQVNLETDKVNETGDFSLDLGSPAVAEPSSAAQTAVTTTPQEQSTATSTDSNSIPFPPIPELN